MPRAVILTAISVEYQAVRSHLIELQEKIEPSGTVYEVGRFITENQAWEVAILETGIGNTVSALETQQIIGIYKPDILLQVGIAGAIKDLSVGDVVVATKIYNYEQGKVSESFQPRAQMVNSTPSLVRRAKSEARKSNWLRRVTAVSTPPPRVISAPIVSGEKVIASATSETFMLLRSNYSDAVAVDMEGFGFLSAASYHPNIAVLVIRGITDVIGSYKTDQVEPRDSLRERAAYHASAFAFELLARIQPKESDTELRDSPDRSPRPQLQEIPSQKKSFPENINENSIQSPDGENHYQVGNNINLSRTFDIQNSCLKADKYAEALATVFNNAKGEVCFAVFGHWGRGKTYLMKLVERETLQGPI